MQLHVCSFVNDGRNIFIGREKAGDSSQSTLGFHSLVVISSIRVYNPLPLTGNCSKRYERTFILSTIYDPAKRSFVMNSR